MDDNAEKLAPYHPEMSEYVRQAQLHEIHTATEPNWTELGWNANGEYTDDWDAGYSFGPGEECD